MRLKNQARANRQFTDILSHTMKVSLNRIESRLDRDLIRRTMHLQKSLERIIAKAAPNSSEYVRNGFAVELADLWHAGEELRKCIGEILALKFPADRQRFRDVLLLLDPLVIQHSEWHIARLKKRTKVLLRSTK